MKIVSRNDIFTLEHLSQEDYCDIQKFYVGNPKGKGLEEYLKYAALNEEIKGDTRTYLVRDNETNEIAAYFSLRTGLITVKAKSRYFDNLTGIELANFAVNDNYRIHKDNSTLRIGAYVFSEFIIPTALKAKEYVGASVLYIFALNETRLINYYKTMGFTRVKNRILERFIHRHVKPKYDKGCIFMYRSLTED